jgi:ribose-phosphate pyrophosphokinase
LSRESLCVVSPDPGGVKRAELFREALEAAVGKPVGKGFADKHRSAGIVTGDLFVGDVDGATALIVDDLISTGGTLLRAARAARDAGARRVIALVAHGLFMPGAAEVIADPGIERIVVTDTVPPPPYPPLRAEVQRNKIDTIPVAPLLADAIRRLHHGQALTDLMVF